MTDHVQPEPDSETWKPKAAFATTLIHGAGDQRPSSRIVTYSRPFAAKPPRPLKNSRSGSEGEAAAADFLTAVCRADGTAAGSARSARKTCSDSVPRPLNKMARAAAWSTSRCAEVVRSAGTMNTPPCVARPVEAA